MENLSDTESSQILGDWDPVDPEGITKVSVPTLSESDDARSNPSKEVEKDPTEIRVSHKEEAARRVLPPWIDPSYEWGGGKWKEDGRKRKKKEKKESDEIPFKEVIEVLLRNSGQKVEEEEEEKGGESCVEILKAIGFKFP